MTGAQVVAAAESAATQAGSMHLNVNGAFGSRSIAISGDITPAGSDQTLTSGSEQATAIVTSTTAYVKGNTAFLAQDLNFSQSDATAYANTWISSSAGSTQYKGLASGATLSSMLSQLMPAGNLTVSGTVMLGSTPAIAVRGATGGNSGSSPFGNASVALYVSASAPYLPLEITLSVSYANSGSTGSGSGGTGSGTPGATGVTGATGATTATMTITAAFSAWGEHVGIFSPQNAVPCPSIKSCASGG